MNMFDVAMKKYLIVGVAVFFVFQIGIAEAQTTPSATIQQLQQQIEALLKQITILQQQVTSLQGELGVTKTETTAVATTTTVPTSVGQATTTSIAETPIVQEPPKTFPLLTRTLARNAQGDDVRSLQEYLAQDKDIYPEGLITGYFGPATERAMKRFQQKHGIEQVGRVGSKSLAKLNELRAIGAGKSGTIPPGLLTAPGIQQKFATATPIFATSTISTIIATSSYIFATTTSQIATTTYYTTTTSNTVTSTAYVYVPVVTQTQAQTQTTTSYATTTTATSMATSTATSTVATAPPIFTITSPNGGESLTAGQTYTITWTSAGTSVSTVGIDLYKGSSYITNIMYNASNNGSYSWTVPPSLSSIVTGSDYKVRIYNNNYYNNYDESNSAFTITIPVSAPSVQPIGYWKFDGSGANEISGSPSAVKVGNSVFNSSGGKFNGYLYIPSSSDYAKIPYNSMFDLPDNFTIEFWFRQRSNQSFRQDLIFKGSRDYYPSGNVNFWIWRQLWNEYNFGPIQASYVNRNTGYYVGVTNSNQLPHNEWHHVVYTKDTSGSEYYLDGASIYRNTDSAQAKTPAVDIIIGNPASDTDIDNLRIYNVALSRSEVLYNYAENISASTATVTTATSTATSTPAVALPAPSYIRADWSYGWWDIAANTMGKRLVFQYPTDSNKKTTIFRLYTKDPGASSFSLAAEFNNIDSTSCSKTGKSVVGQWLLDNNSGTCGYWNINYVKLGTTDAYYQGVSSFPLSAYTAGEYGFYVAAVNSAGQEGTASAVAKLEYLNPLTITFPAAGQIVNTLTPTFQWAKDSSVPSTLPHFTVVFDSPSAANPIWSPYFSGGNSKTYDGPTLDPAKSYIASVFGIDVDTAQNKSTLIMPTSVVNFSVAAPTTPSATSTATSTTMQIKDFEHQLANISVMVARIAEQVRFFLAR